MVNLRSLVQVEGELVRLGLRTVDIRMGEASILEEISRTQYMLLRSRLNRCGLRLLDDKKEILIHRIRSHIIDFVYSDEPPDKNLSVWLGDKLDYDYTYMSNTFSQSTGNTIEQFYICHRIERVKQLLLYEELSMVQIARLLRYSSPAHLSGQFKKITGRTASQFKQEFHDRLPAPVHCG